MPIAILYYAEFICRRACDKKIKSELYVFGWFPGLQNQDFFGNYTAEQVLKSFSGRNHSLKLPVLGFCDSLPYDLEEPIELRVLVVKFWVEKCKKILSAIVFCVFELPLLIY